MAVEVRIPTILRTYTGGEKAVPVRAPRSRALIDDLEGNHPGIKERLIEGGGPAPLRQRLRQRRGRPLHRRPRAPSVSDGDQVVVLPAVAGGSALTRALRLDLLDSVGGTPLVGLPRLSPSPGRAPVGQARGPEPDRLDQGPRRR